LRSPTFTVGTTLSVAAVTLALAGCRAPVERPTTPTTTATSTAPPSEPASPSTTALETSTTTASGPGSTRCTTDRLSLEVQSLGVAAGSQYDALVFTNTGPAPCTLTGFPGVSLRGRDDQPLGEAEHETATPTTVTLAPGGQASARLHTVTEENYDDCGATVPTASIVVIPPDETTSLMAPFEHRRCSGRSVPFDVGAVQPGPRPQPS
jgi:hypothetical protein